jgi:hypothetical protein
VREPAETLPELTDAEIRRKLTIALFELDLLLRLAALRQITVRLDLLERPRAGLHLPDYTTVIAHGLDCVHERTTVTADPATGDPRTVCLDCKRWVGGLGIEELGKRIDAREEGL